MGPQPHHAPLGGRDQPRFPSIPGANHRPHIYRVLQHRAGLAVLFPSRAIGWGQAPLAGLLLISLCLSVVPTVTGWLLPCVLWPWAPTKLAMGWGEALLGSSHCLRDACHLSSTCRLALCYTLYVLNWIKPLQPPCEGGGVILISPQVMYEEPETQKRQGTGPRPPGQQRWARMHTRHPHPALPAWNPAGPVVVSHSPP